MDRNLFVMRVEYLTSEHVDMVLSLADSKEEAKRLFMKSQSRDSDISKVTVLQEIDLPSLEAEGYFFITDFKE